MTARFGEREVEFDVERALEQYRKIRAGSLQGAAVTRALTDIAKQALGPGWRQRIRTMVTAREDEERAEEVPREH